MSEHARLSPSSAHRWMNCPGSVQAEQGYPDTAGDAAIEGTAAHTFIEQTRTSKEREALLGSMIEVNERGQVFQIPVTQEMIDAANTWQDYIDLIDGEEFTEVRVNFSRWAPGNFGTADRVKIETYPETTIAHDIDFKYGKGVRVFAEGNEQLLTYALGVKQEFEILGFEIDLFRLHIVQPRLDHIDEWTITNEELEEFGERVRQAADLALSDNPPRIPGEDQCRWCKAQADCPDLAAFNLQLMGLTFSDISDPTPLESQKLSVGDLARILPHRKLFSNWLKSIEARAFDLLSAGEEVPGWKLVEGRANRCWSSEADAEKRLRSRCKLKIGEIYTKKLVSPAQAEKLLGKQKDKIADLIEKPAGARALAPASDKRSAIEITPVEFEEVAP